MKRYKLNVDPRILELLGPNLYTNIYYVLAELIANAYDADAKNVYIIANSDNITVEDDGHGMSYKNGDIDKFLNVAGVSRTNDDDSLTKSRLRRKMGRKGVGKLAALSVSENVDILTIANGEKSGFILSRRPNSDSTLVPINDDKIIFSHISDHGTAIIMRNPQYRLHKTLSAVKRNLLKIFPLINSDFKITIIRDKTTELISDFDKSIMTELSTLITLGDEFSHLTELVPVIYPDKKNELIKQNLEKNIPIEMTNVQGKTNEYNLVIKGWIGTYTSTRGRKAEMTDFPDNFISLFANKKMGEFNILPIVGQNKLAEVFVVGQLHVDLFELTELPDMALSNRQGYKTDDLRYVTVRDYIRTELLAEILRMRELFTDIGKQKKKIKKEEDLRAQEEELKKRVDDFRNKTTENAAKSLIQLGSNLDSSTIENVIKQTLDDNSPDIGLKAVIDSQKKKILISQTKKDKPLSDVIYQMLIHNNVPSEDILYTNCDFDISRIPEGTNVYDYLRDFFVNSYSTQKIFVLFITSENSKKSWGAITEVGASWITQIDHQIFNVTPCRPEHPLNDEAQWQSTNRETPTDGEFWIDKLNADILCSKIEYVCDKVGYTKKNREQNKSYLSKLIAIKEN